MKLKSISLRIALVALTFTAHADTFKLSQATWKKIVVSNPKTQGLEIQIKYPDTWQIEEGDQPRTAQKWTLRNEDGIYASVSLSVSKLAWRLQLTMDDKKLSDMVDEMYSNDQMTLISKNKTEIDQRTCYIVQTKVKTERLNIKTTSFFHSLILVHKGRMIILCGSVIDPKRLENPSVELSKELYSVFFKFANSLVIL